MATRIIMPKLGLTMTEGKLVKWLVQVGDTLSAGQPVAEIETDKIVTEVESPASGVLGKAVVAEGATVPVAEPIGWIVAPGEALPASEATPAEGPGSAVAATVSAEGVPPRAAPVGEADDAQGRELRISPIARNLAREVGLDLRAVKGTGPGGRIVLEDVKAALAEREKSTEAAPVAPAIPASVSCAIPTGAASAPAPIAQVMPMSGVRRIIAERMAESHRTAAAVTLTTEVDATELVRLREQLKAEAERRDEASVSYTDVLVKAAAYALNRHPDLNARIMGDEIHRLAEVNIGVAVDTDRGLLVPVIRAADRKSILDIARESTQLLKRARSGTSMPDDLTGGTFTVTNLGMFGVDAFTPIINLPECAILGMGRILRKPVAMGDEVVVRPMASLSLTFDHRLVDGAPAARFLQCVAQLIEQPYLLLA